MTDDLVERVAAMFAARDFLADKIRQRHRACAKAVIAIALEEAAKVAEAREDDMGHGKGSQIAAAIRAMIKEST
jgi:hypothetical protein